jgi:hypothetical protein
MNLSTNRSTLLIGRHRDENRLMRAVIELNELLYEEEKFAKDRVELNIVRNSEGEIGCFDFFQVGLKYGKYGEMDRIKNMPAALRDIIL